MVIAGVVGFALLTVAIAGDTVEQRFDAFVEEYGRHYDSKEERLARFEAFKENDALVQAQNAKDNSFKLAINMFADMTSDEFALTHLGLSVVSTQAWGSLPHLGTHEVSNSTVPDAVDWVEKGAVTPVKNQAQCGSCWAFSTTGSLEGAWQIATGALVSLSEQQFVDCAKKFGEQGCNGGIMDKAFQYAEKNAICSDESYPYQGKNGICKLAACKTAIPKGGVVGFKDVQADSTEALMSAVAQQPVSIAIEADKSVFQLYHGGVLTAVCGEQLDHGVLVVGYGTDGGKAYWKVKNSWGPSWGEQGYIRLARGKKGAGECGLQTQPSYPVVSKKPVQEVTQTEITV